MRVITIVCWVITALVLAGLAAWFLTGTVFGIHVNGRNTNLWSPGFNIGRWESLTGPYKLDGTYNVGSADLDSISVDWVSGEITVKPHDGNEIQISEYAQRELRNDEKLTFETSGGTLTIKYRENGYSGNMPSKKLEVLIPRLLCEEMNTFTVDSSSGRVNVSGLNADTVKIHTMSGNIDISKIISGALEANSSSGSITAASVVSNDVKINSMSGPVRISGSTAGTINCDTSSGSINVSGAYDSVTFNSLSGRITLDDSASHSVVTTGSSSGSQEITGSFDRVDIKSLSGSVTIRSSTVPASLRADTASGSITVAVPNEGEIRVHHSSASGRLSSDIPIVVVQGGGSAQFELQTLSGSAKIIAID